MNAPLARPALDEIRAHEAEMVKIGRRSHAHPELACEECATSGLIIGRPGGCMGHHPGYDFDDRVLGTGATCRVRLAEAWLN